MKKKAFTLFTTDVWGGMSEGPCVVPATGSGDRAEAFRRFCKDATDAEAQKREAAQQDRLCVKLDTVLALLDRQEKDRRAKERRTADAALWDQAAARKAQPLPSYPGVYSPDEMAAQWAAEQATDFEARCKEIKAAYDARNPHRKEGRA